MGVVVRDLNPEKQLLLTMDRFGIALPNRQIISSDFFEFNDKNLTGLMIESTFYNNRYSEIVHNKSVSFNINNTNLVLSLVAKPSDYEFYEPLFDMMMLSLKFH